MKERVVDTVYNNKTMIKFTTLIYASEWKGYFSILTKREIGKIKSIQLCQEITGRIFQEDIAESILMGYYAIKNLINWFA